MAKQLNEILPGRSLQGGDVKSKIGNLITEYRRKKKQQGKTGASPSAWPYYDLVDKLLGKSIRDLGFLFWFTQTYTSFRREALQR